MQVTKEETLQLLASGMCTVTANRGECSSCGFSKDRSCTHFKAAEILYARGFRKTEESVKGEWLRCNGPTYTYFRCSICNDWQMQQLPRCTNCFSPMHDRTEFTL